MEKTNINSPRSVNPCTSCSMCAALCPVQCISIVSDTDGFLRPVTDEDKCIGCGLCVKVCYKFDHEVQPQPQPAGQLYAAVADEATVNVCTSGGVGDVLAWYLTSQGIKCAGVVYDDKERCARHIVTDNPADTRHFRGSNIYRVTLSMLSDNWWRKCHQHDMRYSDFHVIYTPCTAG